MIARQMVTSELAAFNDTDEAHDQSGSGELVGRDFGYAPQPNVDVATRSINGHEFLVPGRAASAVGEGP